MLLVWGELQKEREQKEMTDRAGESHGSFFFSFALSLLFCATSKVWKKKVTLHFPLLVRENISQFACPRIKYHCCVSPASAWLSEDPSAPAACTKPCQCPFVAQSAKI